MWSFWRTWSLTARHKWPWEQHYIAPCFTESVSIMNLKNQRAWTINQIPRVQLLIHHIDACVWHKTQSSNLRKTMLDNDMLYIQKISIRHCRDKLCRLLIFGICPYHIAIQALSLKVYCGSVYIYFYICNVGMIVMEHTTMNGGFAIRSRYLGHA